jgi:dienelactone hydrolase
MVLAWLAFGAACSSGRLGGQQHDASQQAPQEAGLDGSMANDGDPPASDGAAMDATQDAGEPDAGPGLRDGGRLADGGLALPLGRGRVSIRAGGLARNLLLYVPDSWTPGNPGMVVLHGNGDTAGETLDRWSGLKTMADSHGVALALPEALEDHYQGNLDWDAETRPPEDNIDIQVTFEAQRYLVSRGVDPQRVYLLGRNLGGFLAFHAGMEGSTRFAAMNVTGAASPLGMGLASEAERKIPVHLLVGENDGLKGQVEQTHTDLMDRGFPVMLQVVPDTGACCPLRGRVAEVWNWMDEFTLP